jgi:hypothetical protein
MVKCQFKDCTVKQAQYGFENDKPKFCSKHKEDGMIDLKTQKCIKCNNKKPYFGLVGDKPTHCGDCKEENMIDLIHKKCIKCNKKIPYFGLVGDKPTHCGDCKEENMIDVISKKCIKCNNKQPDFGLEGELPTHCGDCKEENMINVRSKKCIKCNNKQPNFGLVGEKPTHCGECKEENMINVRSKKCIKCNNKRSTFGLVGEKPTHCGDCKEENMINVRSPRCQSEFCDTQANRKYDGYCAYCYGNLYPDSPVVKNFKTKERLVVDYIKDQYKDYDWVFDKIISNGCSNRRPDIYLDLGYQILIIEVDENQHRQYEDICENKRMMILSQDVNHRSIVFIRFNPDKYINEENKNVPSCFSVTKETGALKVNSKTKWMNRLEILKEHIDYWIEKETNKTIKLVQLFYDENENENENKNENENENKNENENEN